MMDYHEELYAIHNNWAHGRISKQIAITEFENVMKANHLLPQDVLLDPNTTDEQFLILLNQAFGLKPEGLAWLKKQTEAIPVPSSAIIKQKFKCPICRNDYTHLFNEINVKEQEDEGQLIQPQTYKLVPPRCEACAREWLNVHVFKTKNPEAPAVALDITRVSPLNRDELEFFLPYERQMKEPNKS
jgi:hypothetical protein